MDTLQNLNIGEVEYNRYPVYTYKMLKTFKQQGYEKLDNIVFDENPKYTLRDYIMYILEKGLDGFNERFTVIDITCSDTIKKIVDEIFAETFLKGQKSNVKITTMADIDDGVINKIAKEMEYFVNARYDNTRADKVRKEGDKYFKDLLATFVDDKEIISQQDYTDAIKCSNSLKDFIDNNILTTDDLEIRYNMRFIYKCEKNETYFNSDVKCRFDMLVFNNKTKEVTPYLLKMTVKCEFNIYKSFLYNYDYVEADLVEPVLEKMIRQSEYNGYKIMPIVFIPINNKTTHLMLWRYDIPNDKRDILKELYNYCDVRDILDELGYAQQNGGIPKQFKDDIIYDIVDEILKNKKQ